MPMSRPHYGWWGYVKDIIRRYPTLCEQEKALHETCISPDLSGMPRGSGTPTDPLSGVVQNRRRQHRPGACAGTAGDQPPGNGSRAPGHC